MNLKNITLREMSQSQKTTSGIIPFDGMVGKSVYWKQVSGGLGPVGGRWVLEEGSACS